MTDLTATPAVLPLRPLVHRRTLLVLFPLFFLSLVLLVILSPDYRRLAAPVLMTVNLAVMFTVVLPVAIAEAPVPCPLAGLPSLKL